MATISKLQSSADIINIPVPQTAAKDREKSEQSEAVSGEQTWFERAFELLSRVVGPRELAKLATRKATGMEALSELPQRMHRVAEQVKLALELLDDFYEGRYRKVPWRSIAVLAAVVLYSLNPADVVPDYIPLIGSIDDLMVLGLAMRMVHTDLEAYCRFKGYAVERYFG